MNQDNYIYKEKRPWGSFYIIQEEESYKIKKIEVNLVIAYHTSYIKKDLKLGLL